MALEGLESIVRLALRLETVFRVEITSSDMAILFQDPGTWFDGTRMINEFDPDGVPTPETRDRIAGTTEVGIWKSICGGPGESRRTEILLKAKVVLEKDVMGGGEQE